MTLNFPSLIKRVCNLSQRVQIPPIQKIFNGVGGRNVNPFAAEQKPTTNWFIWQNTWLHGYAKGKSVELWMFLLTLKCQKILKLDRNQQVIPQGQQQLCNELNSCMNYNFPINEERLLILLIKQKVNYLARRQINRETLLCYHYFG